MTMEDILTLAKAGFNSQQIVALSQMAAPVGQTVPAQVPPIQQQTVPAQVQQAVPAQVPQTVPAQVQQTVPAQLIPIQQAVPQNQGIPPQQSNSDPIMAEIQKLTGVIQANNLLNTTIPQQVESTDNILAAIINPPVAVKK